MKPAALFLLGIILFFLLVYCGLSAAERGILELTASQNPAGILHCELEKNKINIVFAGKKYHLCLKRINQFLPQNPDISS